MCFYYLLHHILPETATFTEGKRNCATFLIGSIIYAIVYALLKNVQLYYGPMADSSIVAFVLIFIADCATMAYIYKSD